MPKIIILTEIYFYEASGYTIFKNGEFFNRLYIDSLVNNYNKSGQHSFYIDGKRYNRYTVLKENPANKKV